MTSLLKFRPTRGPFDIPNSVFVRGLSLKLMCCHDFDLAPDDGMRPSFVPYIHMPQTLPQCAPIVLQRGVLRRMAL